MKIGELDTHCCNCKIIGYCSENANTPLCEQPRFENVDIDMFLKLAESSKKRSKNAVAEDVYKRLVKEREEDEN